MYTHLERTSQPMIRLVSGDRARWVDEPCPCGRTYPRLPQGLYGRFDDMIIVRGENIYPSAIEDTLRAIEGLKPSVSVRHPEDRHAIEGGRDSRHIFVGPGDEDAVR